MKCTCSGSGAFAGVGAVNNIHCAVCRVQCAEELAVETGWVKLNLILRNNLSKTNSPSVFYLDRLRLPVFENLKREKIYKFGSNLFNHQNYF